MTIEKRPPLPKCEDRFFDSAADGYGGVIRGVRIPCCPLTSVHHGNMNCRTILRKGKCPHNFDYPRDPPPFDPWDYKLSPRLKRQIEEEDRAVEKDNEMLAYLDEIDPLDD
ncbi:hypothetical protein KAU33_08725 [Candidatus Dependentiae bacterium]|nr:hypothetical protein [Candidatus Dependentiae bacterium]